jgi:hypothetical protein
MPVPSDYKPAIPQATDLLSQSQLDLLNNFGAIQALVDINHSDFANPNAGKHNFVEMPVQSPVPTTAGNEVGLYCQTSAITTQPELVFARQAGSTAPAAVQITEFTSAGWTNPGWTVLPSGIMLKWRANIGFGASSTVTINLNATAPASPNFTTTLTILITPIDTAGTYTQVIGIKNVTFPNFTVYTPIVPPGTVLFSYLAIGY